RHEPIAPSRDPKSVSELIPDDRAKPYDVMPVLESVMDAETFIEYKKGYGQTLITGYARVDGWSVGIVANQRSVVKSKQGEMQIGGVIYSDSADKAARFVMNCNQKRIPLVFLQDVTGFMIGKRSEHGGIIKDGAKMVNAVANSTVPKITIVVGNSYGAGNYAMCGKAYDPRFIYAWPSARIAVMGGAQAAKVLTQIQVSALERKGKILSDSDKEEILKTIQGRYDEQTDVRYAASRLWVDGIIQPEDTRNVISRAIRYANQNPVLPAFRTGVIQV
ncbi:MAG: methylcrotonoyl-CoA carboxylase, partial [Bacteroidetes bacterium]